MTCHNLRWIVGVWLVVLLGLVGCGGSSPPTRFYVLTSLQQNPDSQPTIRQNTRAVALGVGPIELPRYLDRPQIAMWTGAHQLEFAEFDQWAEPLQANVARVLAQNLARMLGTDEVVLHPWARAAEPTYQVVVRFTSFEGTMNGQGGLTARWRIMEPRANRELLSKTSNVRMPIQASDYSSIAAALSNGLNTLSQEIANALSMLAQN